MLWLLACLDSAAPVAPAPVAPVDPAPIAPVSADPAPQIAPEPPGLPSALIPIPADRPEAVTVAISDLYPPPRPSPAPGTYLLHDHAVPESGLQERRDGWEVFTEEILFTAGDTEIGSARVDGLRSAAGKVLLSTKLSAGEASMFTELRAQWKKQSAACTGACFPDTGQLDRGVRIAWITEKTVSAWISTSSYSSGAAHANNELSCATWSIKTGKRLKLSEIWKGGAWLKRVKALMKLEIYLEPPEWPKKDTGSFLMDGAPDPILCMPITVGPGGSSHAVRLIAP